MWTVGNSLVAVSEIPNDGRADFAADPFNGQPLPTYDQAQARFCHVNNAPGCLFRSVQELVGPEEYTRELGRTWQNALRFARQIGNTMAFEADYV